MNTTFLNDLENKLNLLKEQGLYKKERIINSSQAPNIRLDTGQEVVNLCANNYLGLASNKRIQEVASIALANFTTCL